MRFLFAAVRSGREFRRHFRIEKDPGIIRVTAIAGVFTLDTTSR